MVNRNLRATLDNAEVLQTHTSTSTNAEKGKFDEERSEASKKAVNVVKLVAEKIFPPFQAYPFITTPLEKLHVYQAKLIHDQREGKVTSKEASKLFLQWSDAVPHDKV
ncbi:uncharacterized protein PHALS_11440 [Plasmopara halstedii]|uniref:Uncharacterized protein n=1 Tax=Plasmopara halstedii TaxID=4781 RepID=A0A0P1A5G8_PLAHL|nr:uncharacterized protein PHALS_11440 [Plasmopara halstedii]CEG35566.1 hypothetical protein PHALS_11440 [Plasmopara halstedii]|eukprot:XP_024571935.1 hypothetical protein PHALS_11440 [Plasmopara halstedii]